MIRLYVAEIGKWLEEGLPPRAWDRLSDACRERLERGNPGRESRRMIQSAAADLLLSRALRQEGRVPPGAALLRGQTEGGKPKVIASPVIEFNLSHSGCSVACALAENPVGVDIQSVEECRDRKAVRMFTPEESRMVRESVHPAETFAFVWTGKEAYLKMRGRGLCRRLDSFRAAPKSGQIEDPVGEKTEARVTWFSPNPAWPDAVLAVCGQESVCRTPVLLSTESLLEI